MPYNRSIQRVNCLSNEFDCRIIGSILFTMEEIFNKKLAEKINIKYYFKNPHVCYSQNSDASEYNILLSAKKGYWAQQCYQLSHELGHIFTNYNKNTTVKKHKWIDEMFCMLASYHGLKQFEINWKKNSPINKLNAQKYNESIKGYLKSMLDKLNIEITSDWFKQELPKMERDCHYREPHEIIAKNLLPIFVDNPKLWEACGSLNLWDTGKDDNFYMYLDSWKEILIKHNKDTKIISILYGLDCIII